MYSKLFYSVQLPAKVTMTTLALPPILPDEFFNIEPDRDHEPLEPSYDQLHTELQSLLAATTTLESQINQYLTGYSETRNGTVPVNPSNNGPTDDPIETIIKRDYGHCNPGVQQRQRKRLQKLQRTQQKQERFSNNNPNLHKQGVSAKCPWKQLDTRDNVNSSVHDTCV